MNESGRMGSSAVDFESISANAAEESFRDLAAAGIAGAENENANHRSIGR
jgi:hypothetical protein